MGVLVDDELPSSDLIYSIFFNYYLVCDALTNRHHPTLNIVQRGLTFMRDAIKGLNWPMTPWCHVFIEHMFEFESRTVRPIFLTCHSLEGSHKISKQYFSFSLKSTKRNHGRNGLCDLIHRDNVTLNLISRGIFPWNDLKLCLGFQLPTLTMGSLHFS